MYVFLVRLLMAMLTAIDICMLIRAILSFFPTEEETAIERFAFIITEPFIIPVRAIVMRIEFFRTLPIDMSFFITAILITVIEMILGASI